MAKELKDLTKRADNYSQWYNIAHLLQWQKSLKI